MICDGQGLPLAVRLTGANRHDSTEALPLVDAIPPLQGERGRPGAVRTASSAIVRMTRRPSVTVCAPATFTRCWLCVERGTAAAWDAGAGWWNGRVRG